MNAKTLVRCGGFLSALAATASTAQSPAPEPAARLVRAVPVLEPSAAIIVRGLAPVPEAAAPKAAASWINGPVPTTVRPLIQPTSVSPESRPTMNPSGPDSTWQSLKNFLIGPPAPSNPQPPTAASRTAPTAVQPAPMMTTPPIVPTMHPGVYAGPPAYRWYGWGTTTPGRNPLAPTGQSPSGSSTWFAQTGATPGAFPVTAQPTTTYANAPQYRPSTPMPTLVSGLDYGFAPEVYATGLPPLPPGAIAIADGSPVPYSTPYVAPILMNNSQPLAVGSSEVPMPMPTLPVPPTFEASAPSTPSVATMPVFPLPPSAPPSVNWSSASGSTPFGPSVQAPAGTPWTSPTTIGRPQAPTDPAAATLDARIRHAAGSATVVEIKHVGLSKLLIRLRVNSAAEARIAVDAIAALPVLKPYAVDFEVAAPAK